MFKLIYWINQTPEILSMKTNQLKPCIKLKPVLGGVEKCQTFHYLLCTDSIKPSLQFSYLYFHLVALEGLISLPDFVCNPEILSMKMDQLKHYKLKHKWAAYVRDTCLLIRKNLVFLTKIYNGLFDQKYNKHLGYNIMATNRSPSLNYTNK